MEHTLLNQHTKYVSKSAPPELLSWLYSMGYKIELINPVPTLSTAIASHADLQMCRLGCRDSSKLIRASESEAMKLEDGYPRDIPFNAACTGKYFIHKLNYTKPKLLEAACKASMVLVDVPQGYAKCSTVIVDERSIITYDAGIARACSKHNMNILEIEPGYVSLPGYDTGFIGGASGRVGDTIVFCGNIAKHPSAYAIVDFIKSRGLDVKAFDFPLLDIGSII